MRSRKVHATATFQGRARWRFCSGQGRPWKALAKLAFCASSSGISLQKIGVLGQKQTNLPPFSSATPRVIGGENFFFCATSLLPAGAKRPTRPATRRHAVCTVAHEAQPRGLQSLESTWHGLAEFESFVATWPALRYLAFHGYMARG